MMVKHNDIESAYLNGDLSHEVYMKQPAGSEANKEQFVCKLMKHLYGLQQGANEWNKNFDDILLRNGYNRGTDDHCIYSKQENGEWIYLCLHVDDLIVATTEERDWRLTIDDFEIRMSRALVIKNLGNLQYHLDLQLGQKENPIFSVHSTKYIEVKLKEFNFGGQSTFKHSYGSKLSEGTGNSHRRKG